MVHEEISMSHVSIMIFASDEENFMNMKFFS